MIPVVPTRLFLIDGNSLVFRAFFALPESIATTAGEPTNAILGLASMLVKIVADIGLVPTIVAWDAGTSGRKELYSEYKANRSSRPDLLKAQWPAFEPLVEAFGFRNASVEGCEADDVIATLAERARERGMAVTIVTGDRDALQLIDKEGLVEVMATARGVTDTKLYDHAAVIERWGVPPELIPDLYGLKGDSSDNIPGVPGIGDKGAAELLQRFGSLEGVLEHAEEVGGAKRRANLVEHAEDARISKQLATAQRDLDLPFDLDALLDDGAPDRTRLREAFRRWELRDPLRRLEEVIGDDGPSAPEVPAAEAPAEAPPTAPTVPVREAALADVEALPADLAVAVAVRPPDVPDGALFADSPVHRFAVAIDGEVLIGECGGPAELVSACGERPVTAHDAKALDSVPAVLAHDTLLAAYLLEPARRSYPLRELCEERGLVAGTDDEVAADALLIAALAEHQGEELRKFGLLELLRDVEQPLVAVLRQMERRGVRLNVERLRTITERVVQEIETLQHEIHEAAGEEFLISSPQQLSRILFEKLSLSRRRRGKTGFSTDARVLAAIRDEHPIVALIERWRELSTLVKTYLAPLPSLIDEQSRLHTTFLQTVATTGRLSSKDPNLQNVPARTSLGLEIRGCFEAAPGAKLLAADYSQIELRVLAQFADEPVLKDVFRSGGDVHSATACRLFDVEPDAVDAGMRSKAKMVNYGIVYGLTGFGLADRLQIPREEAQTYITAYFERFPAVSAFIERTVADATTDGYVTTLLGRRRAIPELSGGSANDRMLGERLAVNTVLQGTAADIIKIAMIRCEEALESLQTNLILQIHDELLFEGPPEEMDEVGRLVADRMAGAWELDPPLVVNVGIGDNWSEMK